MVLLLFLQSSAQSHEGSSPFITIRVQNIGLENGLSQGYTSSILQDKNGFLWIASKDGLNRYDGHSIVVYKNESDGFSPASSNVRQIFEDLAGRLWITFDQGGLDLFDTELGEFKHVIPIKKHPITTDPGGLDIISSIGDGIVIVFDKNFYIINVNKVRVTPKKGKQVFHLETHWKQLFPANGSGTFSWGNSAKISTSSTGAIWMLDLHSSLFELKIYPEKGQYKLVECIVPPALIPSHTKKMSPPFYAVDRLRNWIYFQQYGSIYRLNGNSGIVELFMKNTPVECYAVTVADANGDIWLSHRGDLHKIDVAQKKLLLVKSDNLEIEKKKTFNCGSTYVDQAGDIWVCTIGHGLLKINLRNTYFHHIRDETSVNCSIKYIDISNNGNFHIVSWRGDDFLLDTLTMKLTPCRMKFAEGWPRWSGRKIDFYPFIQGKTAIPVDILNAGNYFLRELDDFRLILFDPQKGFAALLHKEEKNLLGVFLLGANHTVWFITNKKTLRSIDLATGMVNSFEIPGIAKEAMRTMVQDPDGTLWIATEDGICRFDPSSKQWQVYLRNTTRADGLMAGNILCFSFSRLHPNFIWIGTEGKGFIKMNITDGTCRYYFEEDGLVNDVVYGILPDNSGNLWMSTNRGLSCFDPVSEQFRNFAYEDGLQSGEFNRYSYGLSSSGWMLFGGVNGINYFNPAEIVTSRYKPKILLTNIFVNGNYIAPWVDDLSLRHSLYNIDKEIKLSHHQNVISFQFSSSDFTTPELNQFSYKLEGIDKDWSRPSPDHEATYTYLPPGSYVFRVRGTNRDGIWSPNELSFPFLIAAPCWQTWWFKSIIILLIIGAIYGIYKIRMNHLLKVQAIRNRISADMHDEIGSTLSSISFYSQALLMQNLDQKQKLVIAKIKDVAQRVQEELSDIVWSVKADMDSFENIFARMQRVGNELLESKNILFHFEADETLRHQKMEMMMRKNFYLIFKEALNNAAKYAQCKNVWVKISDVHPQIKMEIRDDGSGFDLEGAKNGNGLENMQRRAESMKGKLTISSANGCGTGVVLLF